MCDPKPDDDDDLEQRDQDLKSKLKNKEKKKKQWWEDQSLPFDDDHLHTRMETSKDADET